MTDNIKNLLEKIAQDDIFDKYSLYFIGGTALSTYIEHRISYDIDITSNETLPISAIKAFAYSIGATLIPDTRASTFKINRGENLENYYLKFMVDGIKLEFSYFDDNLRQSILKNATKRPYLKDSKLKILGLKDIITLKSIALFNRQKSRDLFDLAIVLEKDLISIEELERIYSFYRVGDKILYEYINSFDIKKDKQEDSSLDFLPKHKHYKTFAKLSQDERFEKAKELFFEQYNLKQKDKLQNKQKQAKRIKRG